MAWPAMAQGARGTPWGSEAIRRDPLGYLAAEREGAEALAALLERIADALPQIARPSALLVAAARLRRYVLHIVPIEDAALLGPLATCASHGAAAARMVEIVRRKGALLAGHAVELADLLESLAPEGAAREAEALGFTLRACFDALRRRTEWVEAAVLPQIAPLLTEADRAALGDRLAQAVAGESLGARAGLVVLQGARPVQRVSRSQLQ